MDHLNCLLGACHPVELPLVYRARVNYDRGTFLQFGVRISGKASFNIMDFSASDIGRNADILQAWFFFGLLYEVSSTFGVALDVSDFITDDGRGPQSITTRNLTQYLWFWVAADTHANLSTRATRRREIAYILRFAELSIRHLIMLEYNSNKAGERVLIPLAIVYDLLLSTAQGLLGLRSGKASPPPQALFTLSKRAGWCAGELHTFCLLGFTAAPLYVLAAKQKRQDGKTHRKCTDTQCNAHQLDETTYKTAHVTPDCTCQHHLQPGVSSQIGSILNGGGIPTFRVLTSPKGTLEIEVFDSSKIKRYVAISHVWSDGLGNTTGNTLPKCLLLRIQAKVQRLYPQDTEVVSWWIDTLCVPREMNLRIKAIRGLVHVYSRADKVLIMDKTLQCLSNLNSSIFDRVLHTAISPWSRRLWTFQEGWLAKELFFDFEDEPKTRKSLYDAWRAGDGPNKLNIDGLKAAAANSGTRERSALCGLLFRALAAEANGLRPKDPRAYLGYTHSIPGFPTENDNVLAMWLKNADIDPVFVASRQVIEKLNGRQHCSEEQKWSQAMSALQGRTTSRISDEVICLANLMEKDNLAIVKAPSEQRMKILLLQMQKVPTALLFTPFPRLDEVGFRWAPKSLLHPGPVMGASFHASEVTANGLHARLPGMLLSLRSKLPDKAHRIQVNESGKAAQLGVLTDSTGPEAFWNYYATQGRNLAVVLAPAGLIDESRIDAQIRDRDGALVELQGMKNYREGDTLKAIWLSYVAVSVWSEVKNPGAEDGWAKSLEANQQWRLT